jgi:hypothetical protein
VTFFNTWIVPALLLCLMVLWLWMEIRDKIRREDAEARHDSALRVLNRQIRVLELRCDALSKRADPHKPLSVTATTGSRTLTAAETATATLREASVTAASLGTKSTIGSGMKKNDRKCAVCD